MLGFIQESNHDLVLDNQTRDQSTKMFEVNRKLRSSFVN